MHHPTHRITHTTAFVTPVVEHWLEWEIAQWVHPMKDRSDDTLRHERTLYLWATSRSPINRILAQHDYLGYKQRYCRPCVRTPPCRGVGDATWTDTHLTRTTALPSRCSDSALLSSSSRQTSAPGSTRSWPDWGRAYTSRPTRGCLWCCPASWRASVWRRPTQQAGYRCWSWRTGPGCGDSSWWLWSSSCAQT